MESVRLTIVSDVKYLEKPSLINAVRQLINRWKVSYF
jgi:hypothetical protein